MEDDNIFDEDDALDYQIYEDLTQGQNNKTRNGCLSLVVLIALPVGGLALWALTSLTT